MTATPAPALTPAEQATVDRFGIFEPEEREAALVESVARAMWEHEQPGATPWAELFPTSPSRDRYRNLATAAIAAYRAAQDGGAEEAVRRVEALCDVADDQPDGYECQFIATHLVRTALAPQAGDEPCPIAGGDSPCVLPAGHIERCLR